MIHTVETYVERPEIGARLTNLLPLVFLIMSSCRQYEVLYEGKLSLLEKAQEARHLLRMPHVLVQLWVLCRREPRLGDVGYDADDNVTMPAVDIGVNEERARCPRARLQRLPPPQPLQLSSRVRKLFWGLRS